MRQITLCTAFTIENPPWLLIIQRQSETRYRTPIFRYLTMFEAKYNVCIIDDDPEVSISYQYLLNNQNYQTLVIKDAAHFCKQIPPNWVGVVLCNTKLSHHSGLSILKEIMLLDKKIPVIMISEYGNVPMAVNAMKIGAINFLEKPIAAEALLFQVENALSERRALIEQRQWQLNKLNNTFIGQSEWVSNLRQQLQKLANSHLPVFLWGDNGTGRYLSATNLHRLSTRKNAPFVLHECSENIATPIENLLAQSENGTLVIKHLHLLSVNEQQTLALALHNEEKPFRLIAISDFPLWQLIQHHHLSSELYPYFIHTQIELLPLHKHPNDIAAIFQHYVQKSCTQLNKTYTAPPKKLLQHLTRQSWEGNVSELINVAELYAIGLFANPNAATFDTAKIKPENTNPLETQLARYEKQIIEDALMFFQGRINQVAGYLEIPRKKLYLRMQKYGLDKSEYKL